MAVRVLGTQARDEVVAMRVSGGRGGRGGQRDTGLGAAVWGRGSPSGQGSPGSFHHEAGLMVWETNIKQPNTLKKYFFRGDRENKKAKQESNGPWSGEAF